ncbi:hypothetical protein RR47_GL000409 [Enterococcus columbae DSM 7374 = ATCC 51263]|nr:hypothetical protein RR47_GL000409 [Enterococcus columbae DSM 7374 = ATCC 51263]
MRFFQQLGLFIEYQLNNMPFTSEAMRQAPWFEQKFKQAIKVRVC